MHGADVKLVAGEALVCSARTSRTIRTVLLASVVVIASASVPSSYRALAERIAGCSIAAVSTARSSARGWMSVCPRWVAGNASEPRVRCGRGRPHLSSAPVVSATTVAVIALAYGLGGPAWLIYAALVLAALAVLPGYARWDERQHHQ